MAIQLRQKLKEIFRGNDQTRQDAQEEEQMNQLAQLALAPSKMMEFENFLIDEFGHGAATIFYIVNAIVANDELQKTLGNKILCLWLKYKFFWVLDLLKPKEKDKRKKISNYFVKIDTSETTLDILIKQIYNLIDQKLKNGDLSEISNKITQGKEKEIKSLFGEKFVKEVKGFGQKQLQEMRQDYAEFLENSILKRIQRQIIKAFVIKNRIQQKDKDLFKDFQSFAYDFAGLKKLLSKQMNSNSQMRQIIEKLQSLPKENTEIYSLLLRLKSFYQIIDVPFLQRLIKHTQKFQIYIKSKELVPVIGNIGSGKTTNILAMLGYRLTHAYQNGLKTLIPQQILQKEHESFLTSPEASSCTKYMNATPIPDKMYKFGIMQNKRNLVLCDFPGFGDTRGIEVDIYNGVSMIDSLSQAKSIRIVIILAYEAIIKDKSKGFIDIGTLISGLIKNIHQNKHSILILFNKVPIEEIQSFPLKLRNKIQNLNPLEATNDKLKQFLEIAAESADHRHNYLDPLNGDYKKVVQKISKLSPLYEIGEKLNYQFEDSTKKQIIYFGQQYRNRVIEYFQRKEFEQSAYFLRMLEKLKNIVISSQKLNSSFEKCLQFVKNYSSKLFITYKKNLEFIEKAECTESIIEETQNIKIQLQKLANFFENIEGIQMMQKQKFDESFSECRQRVLLNIQGIKRQNLNKSILSIKILSKIFGDQIVKSSISKFEQISQPMLLIIQNLFKENRFGQSSDLLIKIKIIIEFISFFQSSHGIKDSFQKIKEKLIKLLHKYKQTITAILIQPNINENDCAQIQNSLEKIAQILGLNMVDSYQQSQQFAQQSQKIIINSFNDKKKKLEKCAYSLKKLEGQQSLIQMNFQEEVKDKIVILENLSNLKPFTEQFKKQCKEVKQTIILRLKSNYQILKQNFSRLKSINLQERAFFVGKLKVECSKVLQGIELIETKDSSEAFSQIIGNLFVDYCSQQLLRIDKVKDLTLKIQQQNFKKIELQYLLIKSYSLLAFINQNSQKIVSEIQEKLLTIIKLPLNFFIDVELKQLQLKQYYKCLLEKKIKMQKIFHYITSLKHYFTEEDYKKIMELQVNISNFLLPFLKNVKKDIKHFIELQSFHIQTDYLNDLLKFLCQLSSIDKIKIFLANSRELEFQLDVEINSIFKCIDEIYIKINNAFGDLNDDQDNFQHLVRLLKTCKFYCSTEQFIIKICKKKIQTNFQELQTRINNRFIESIKKIEEKIRFLIEGKLYSQICWEQLQQIYKKIIKYSNKQSKSIKSLLIKQLRSIQIFYQKSLKKITFEYQGRINEFPKNQENKRLLQNIITIQESIQFYSRLRKLFTDQDKQSIIIHTQIQNQIIKMLQFYDSLFQKAKWTILSYNFLIERRISHQFQNFSAKIWESIQLKEEIEFQTWSTFKQQLKQSIKQKKKALILQMKNFDSQYIEDSFEQMERKSIKYYLQDLQKIIDQQINRKYLCAPNQLIIDKNLSILYSILSKSDSKQFQQKRQNLTKNIQSYMTNHLSNIRNASRTSLQQTQTLIQSFNNILNILPQQLKRRNNQQLKILQKDLLEQKQKTFSNITKELHSEFPSMDTIIPIVQQISKKKQTIFHKEIMEHIQNLLTKKINNHIKIIDKIKIINIYCIQGVKNHIAYLSNDQLLLRMLENVFMREIQNIFGTVKRQLQKIGKYFENYMEIKANIMVKNIIKDIFSIVPLLKNLSNHRQHLKEQFQSVTMITIIKSIEIYENQLLKKPILSIFSFQIMDDKISSLIQRYIQYIRTSIDVWEAFKTQILQSQSFFPQQLQHKIASNISHSTIIINNFQKQIRMNIDSIEAIDFQNQSIKNLTFEDISYRMEKVDFILSVFKFREKIINNNILCGKNIINAQGMINNFVRKIEELKIECLRELQQLLQDYCHETSFKVYLLLMIINCIKQKKLKLLTKQRFQHLSSQINKLITNRLGIALKNSHQNYESCKRKVNQYRNQIIMLQKKRQNDYENTFQKLNIQFQKKVLYQQQKYQSLSKNQKDANRLKCQQISKYTQITVLSNQFQNKIKEQNKDIQSQFSYRLNELYEEQAKQIINFSDNLLKIVKFIRDIDYKREKYEQQLKCLFLKLKNSGQNFIGLLKQYFSNNHKDIYKVGEIIISNLRTPQVLNHFTIPNTPPQYPTYSYSTSSHEPISNQFPEENNPTIMMSPPIKIMVVRTLIGIDGSGLNEKSIAQFSQILTKSFEYSYNVLSYTGIKAIIQMKIIVYMDYDWQAQNIARATNYESNPNILIDFLQRMPVCNTNVTGTTAVEVFLYSANMQQTVDQILMISEKSPNKAQDIINKRAYYGENYWNSCGLPMTYLQNQVNKILSKKCPIHNLFMGSHEGFKIISEATNGSYFPYNHFSVDSSIIFYVQTLLQQTMRKSNCVINLLEVFQQMII